MEHEISDYPNDYNMIVQFSDNSVTFSNEAVGMINLRYHMSINELIKAGELAKKYKESTYEI